MESADASFEKRAFFSLIELMLVISVILIVGTLSISSISNSRRQARQAFCTNNLRQLALGFQMYQQDYKSFPVTERFLDDFLPVYSYEKSLSVFTCPGNPSTVSRINTQAGLVGGTDYVFWSGQLATDLPADSSSTTDSDLSSGDSDGCNCNSNVCTCGRGNGKGNNGGNGKGNNKDGSGNSNGKGNGNGNNGGNSSGSGSNGSGSSDSGSSTASSAFFAYGANISDSKFQRTLADKLTRPVLYDKCGPAHGNYINLCDLRDASVSSRRDMCDLWVLNSSKSLIVDSTDPFPK